MNSLAKLTPLLLVSFPNCSSMTYLMFQTKGQQRRHSIRKELRSILILLLGYSISFWNMHSWISMSQRSLLTWIKLRRWCHLQFKIWNNLRQQAHFGVILVKLASLRLPKKKEKKLKLRNNQWKSWHQNKDNEKNILKNLKILQY